MVVSGEQLRAARAMARVEQADLASRAGVSVDTIKRLERTEGPVSANVQTISAVVHALEAAGVAFIPENGGGAGVRLVAAQARLFRRDDVPDMKWVAFAYDRKGKRQVGFVHYDALGRGDPTEAFDRERARILEIAVGKTDRGDLDPEGRVHVEDVDLGGYDAERPKRLSG